MELNDDILLTAYLDGELSQSDRLAVEAALKSNPRLATVLRELESVRGLVAGLSRPGTPRDVVGPVMSRLAHRPWRRLTSIRRSDAATVSGLAAAAALMVTIAVWPRPPARPIEGAAPVVVGHSNAGVPEPHARPAVAPVERVIVEGVKPDRAPDVPRVATGPDRNEIERDRQHQRYEGDLLGTHPSRRILVTGQDLMRTASEVQELLSNTPRTMPDFSRRAVAKGLEVEPGDSSEAVVFVLVMDETELRYLRTRIEGNLHLSLRDLGTAAPPMRMMLADIGQVNELSGRRADKLKPPPAELSTGHAALKESSGKKDTQFPPRDLPPESEPGFPAPLGPPPTATTPGELSASPAPGPLPQPGHRAGSGETGSAAETARPGAAAKASPSQPDSLMTVLIWVKARDGQGH
jgi:hypothetical protein